MSAAQSGGATNAGGTGKKAVHVKVSLLMNSFVLLGSTWAPLDHNSEFKRNGRHTHVYFRANIGDKTLTSEKVRMIVLLHGFWIGFETTATKRDSYRPSSFFVGFL